MTCVRMISESDAPALLQCKLLLDEESNFMMLEPGERDTTVEQERQQIANALSKQNDVIFVVDDGDTIIGYLMAEGGQYRRNRHTVYIVVGLLRRYWGQGLGEQLFLKLEEWACTHSIHRLELTVNVTNKRALNLYHKLGFKIEGTKRGALLIGGTYVDEYYMAKLINHQ